MIIYNNELSLKNEELYCLTFLIRNYNYSSLFIIRNYGYTIHLYIYNNDLNSYIYLRNVIIQKRYLLKS